MAPKTKDISEELTRTEHRVKARLKEARRKGEKVRLYFIDCPDEPRIFECRNSGMWRTPYTSGVGFDYFTEAYLIKTHRLARKLKSEVER